MFSWGDGARESWGNRLRKAILYCGEPCAMRGQKEGVRVGPEAK